MGTENIRITEDMILCHKIDPKDPNTKKRLPQYEAALNRHMENSNPWSRFRFMIHAGGKCNGYPWTNSKEAMEQSLEKGCRFIELDFKMTKDSHLVCSHGWNKYDSELVGMTWKPEFRNMTRELFLAQTIHGLHTMDAEALYHYMKEYPDLHIELDWHHINRETTTEYAREFLRAMHGDEEILSRCLLQIQNFEMLQGAREVYDFPWISFQIPFANHRAILEHLDLFLEELDRLKVFSVAVPTKLVRLYPELVTILKNHGIYLIFYSAEKKSVARASFLLGADCVCCDEAWNWQDLMEKVLWIHYMDGDVEGEFWQNEISKGRLRGEYTKTEGDGIFKERVVVSDDEVYRIKPCCFVRPGHSFVGWNIVNGKTEDRKAYLCKDEEWHTLEEIQENGLQTIRLSDQSHLPDLNYPDSGRKVYLEAVWKESQEPRIHDDILRGEKISSVKILYHSQRPAREHVSGQLAGGTVKGSLQKTEKGAWELSTEVLMGSDGRYALLHSPFTCEGFRQTGWYARIKVDNEIRWYGRDENWHTLEELEKGKLSRYLFTVNDHLTGQMLCGRSQIVFEAVWKWEGILHRYLGRLQKKL